MDFHGVLCPCGSRPHRELSLVVTKHRSWPHACPSAWVMGSVPAVFPSAQAPTGADAVGAWRFGGLLMGQHASLASQTHRDASWWVGLCPIPNSKEDGDTWGGARGVPRSSSTHPATRLSGAVCPLWSKARPSCTVRRALWVWLSTQAGGQNTPGRPPPHTSVESLVIGSTGFCFSLVLHGDSRHPRLFLCERPLRHRPSRTCSGKVHSVHP